MTSQETPEDLRYPLICISAASLESICGTLLLSDHWMNAPGIDFTRVLPTACCISDIKSNGPIHMQSTRHSLMNKAAHCNVSALYDVCRSNRDGRWKMGRAFYSAAFSVGCLHKGACLTTATYEKFCEIEIIWVADKFILLAAFQKRPRVG